MAATFDDGSVPSAISPSGAHEATRKREALGYPLLKSTLDYALASLVLLLTSPLIAGAALAILILDGRPLLFRQIRPGLNGRPFAIYKLRTMKIGEEPDGERQTAWGRVLRATSVDELPALLNVLRGEMSLVGPRPLLMAYLDRYTPEQARRHLVKPGITGLAQIRGRNLINWEDRFALDLWYVDNRSLALDLKIIAWTLIPVLRRNGVNAAKNVTMPEFLGHERETPIKPAR